MTYKDILASQKSNCSIGWFAAGIAAADVLRIAGIVAAGVPNIAVPDPAAVACLDCNQLGTWDQRNCNGWRHSSVPPAAACYTSSGHQLVEPVPLPAQLESYFVPPAFHRALPATHPV